MKKIWETGRACSHNSANLAGAAQRPDCAPKGSTTLNVSTTPNVGKKRSRLLKVFAASGLAFFMGIGTLCGVLIAPANTAAQMQSSEEAAATAQEKALMEAQEALWNGTLELDPENDPVLGTTENGITIRFHNKSLSGTWNYNTFMTNYFGPTTSTYQSGTFYNLSGYLYITLGGYNWIIIGRNSSLNTVSFKATYAQGTASPNEFVKFASYNTYANALKGQQDTTPAGSAISAENSTQIVNTVSTATRTYSVTLSSYNVVSSADLNNYSGCVLCLCAGTTGNSYYDNTSPYYSYFPSSDLDTAMTTVYNNIKSAAGNQIQSTSLTTYGYNGSSYTTYTHSEYLFPLATNTVNTSQNFCVETYLNTDAKRDIDAYWWMRSGNSYYSDYAYIVYTAGSLASRDVSLSCGVRPAFVLKVV